MGDRRFRPEEEKRSEDDWWIQDEKIAFIHAGGMKYRQRTERKRSSRSSKLAWTLHEKTRSVRTTKRRTGGGYTCKNECRGGLIWWWWMMKLRGFVKYGRFVREGIKVRFATNVCLPVVQHTAANNNSLLLSMGVLFVHKKHTTDRPTDDLGRVRALRYGGTAQALHTPDREISRVGRPI